MKKVAIFIYSLGGGGAEKAILELATGLKNDFDVRIVTMSPVQSYDDYGFEVVSLHRHDLSSSVIDKALSVFKIASSFASYCKKEGIEVVISALSRPNLIAALAKMLYPRLYLIAAEHTTLSNYYDNTTASKALKFALSLAYKVASKVVAVSSGIKDDLVQNFGVKKSKVHVIYNPVDIQKIKLMALQGVDRNSSEFVFVTAGRLVESKNYPFLFEAFKSMPSFCKLWILGAGELESELKFLAVEMGIHERVTFFGFCENPYSYFASADAFVMSSRLEGLPTVLIEALACGVPVISTDCKSGPREILKGDADMLVSGMEKAEYGLLVSLDSPRFLALAMSKMVDEESLRVELRKKSAQRVNDFSKEHAFEAYKKLILKERS